MQSRPPLSLSLRQLQYAVAVADARSFRRAAELCRVAQPSLSAQLAQLESALGVRLFERDRRGVLPTAAGEELIGRARRLLLDADDLSEAARRLADPMGGVLRIGAIPTVSPYLLPDVAPALRRTHERLTVQWTEDKTEALVAKIALGELDAAMLALEARLGEMEHERIGDDPFVLAAPKGHPLALRRGPVHLDDLRDAQVLLLDDGHCLRDQALSVCTRAHARERDFRATSLGTLIQMVSAGAGVTLLPTLAVATEVRRSTVVIRPLAPPAPHRTLALAWRIGSAREPALRAVAATMRTTYERTRSRPAG